MTARTPPAAVDRYALAKSLRMAIVIPAVFAFVLVVLDNGAMAPFAFFGTLALLRFVDFGGSWGERLAGYLATIAAGTALVALGTLCSSSTALATASMAVVGFAILFAGAFSPRVATVSRATTLAFVLPVMVPLAQDDLPNRVAGWLFGTGVALVALMLPWPRRPPDRLRGLVGRALGSVAAALAAAAGASAEALRRARAEADDAVWELWLAYLGAPARPNGAGGRSAALGRTVDDLLWIESLPPPGTPARPLRLGMLAVATDRLAGDALRAAGRAPPGPAPGRDAPLATLRELATAHLSARSVWLRNSVRGALGLSLAVLVGHVAEVQHAFWIVLGTLIVLRPQAAATGVTFVQMLAGTLAGIVAGGLLMAAVGTDTAVLWAIFPVVALVADYARTAVGFVVGQAFFSFQILIVFNLIQGTGWTIGLVRVEDVAIGATISLVTATLLWPRGAASVLRDDFADAYRATARLLAATVRGPLGGRDPERLDELSLRASGASWRLDATVRQFLSERAHALSRDDLSALVAGVRRLRRAADELRDSTGPPPTADSPRGAPPAARAERAALEREVEAVTRWYSALGDAIRDRDRPPAASPPPPREAPDRLALAWTHAHLAHLAGLAPPLAEAGARLARAGD